MSTKTSTRTATITTSKQRNTFVLAIECQNRIGIVSAVASLLADRGCNIVDSQQFDDQNGSRFFMRVEVEAPTGFDFTEFREWFTSVASKFDMSWHLLKCGERMRTLIMVTKADHCFNELIDLWQSDLLNNEIVGIVGNREALASIAERAGIPFHYIPVTAETKEAAETELCDLSGRTRTELVVLARYLQILSEGFCSQLPGQIINIHHSFFPGFKGSRPYQQAFDRGVKMIGATAHYVTTDLDEGPIIAQSVLEVDHRSLPRDLAIAGRRAERAALARAVAWHSDRRIFLNGLRTVIFDWRPTLRLERTHHGTPR